MDFRLDRFITLYLVSPLQRLSPGAKPAIPILMYHSVADQDESRTPAYYRIATSPAAFAAQMEYLHQSGYQTCSVTEAIDILKTGSAIEDRRVVITFDDGYRDFYLNAFPVLSQFGYSATMYLASSFIGDTHLQFKGRDCLKWAEIRELQKYGISFGSHTATHPQLRDLDHKSVEKEIVSSKLVIEEKTGNAVDSFAYPYAFPQKDLQFKKILRESLCSAGYRNGVCTIIGRARSGSDPLFTERLPVNSRDDRKLFKAKLSGAYDWLAKPQAGIKTVKNLIA
jgi:peptidoglycan/xylan/chitin deacetylase (PgdA/CDA1 family)